MTESVLNEELSSNTTKTPAADDQLTQAIVELIYAAGEPRALTIEKKVGWYIHGSTGCSCCRSENFISGFYHTEDEGIDALASHEKRKTVRSQYSNTGLYTLYKTEYEELSDGRIIFANRVFDDANFYENGNIAEEIRGTGEQVISAGGYLPKEQW